MGHPYAQAFAEDEVVGFGNGRRGQNLEEGVCGAPVDKRNRFESRDREKVGTALFKLLDVVRHRDGTELHNDVRQLHRRNGEREDAALFDEFAREVRTVHHGRHAKRRNVERAHPARGHDVALPVVGARNERGPSEIEDDVTLFVGELLQTIFRGNHGLFLMCEGDGAPRIKRSETSVERPLPDGAQCGLIGKRFRT